MRCKNCGWTNEENVVRCVKCNAPLQGSMIDSNRQNAVNSSSNSEDNPKSTLREVGQNPYPNPYSDDNEQKCPNCNYSIAIGMKECPMCHTQLVQPQTDNRQGQKNNRANYERRQFNPQQNGFRPGGTINNWAIPSNETFFTLKRIPWDGEAVKYEPVSYSGQSNILNRSNTDPNNNSITSREQAVITFENGKWYLVNRSDYKTTFIRADRKLKLEDGDVIVLGNRMFEFRKS